MKAIVKVSKMVTCRTVSPSGPASMAPLFTGEFDVANLGTITDDPLVVSVSAATLVQAVPAKPRRTRNT